MSSPLQRLRSWVYGSLGARIITLVLTLLLVLQVASFGAIRASLQASTRAKMPGELATADRVLKRLLDQQGSTLSEKMRVLAFDPGLDEALQIGEVPTIVDTLDNLAKRISAAEVMIVGLDYKPQAYSGNANKPLEAAAAPLIDGLRRVQGQGQDNLPRPLALVGNEVMQVLAVPISAPRTVPRGWMVMAFPVQQRLVSEMRQLSDKHLTLMVRQLPTQRWTVALSSLPAAKSRALSELRWVPEARVSDEIQEVEAASENLAVRTHWFSQEGRAPGAVEGAAVLALVTASIDDAVRISDDLQYGLLMITLVGFIAFGFGSVLTARRVTTPLRDLANAAERLGAGDFTTPMRRLRRTDEIGELAIAFERMRINVADKQAEVQKLAYWDPLTGLPNRVQFRNAVAEAITLAQGQGHTVAVIMLDLDRFKHVNDVLGYRLGDMLLTCLADRLKGQIVRGDDMVARLSGDEFAILLRRGDAALAQSVAVRIMRAFDEPLELEEHTVDMGAGIGMACWPEHASDTEQLLSRAEVAMYTAKRRASGPLLYDASIDASSAQTLSLLSELRHAVDHGELRLFLQPKLGLGKGDVVGAETLVRWMHPTRGMVPPMQFIPFAEQTGFIRNLTMWIFEEAARHWIALQAEGLALTLSINLSTRDLLDQDLPQKFATLLARHGVPTSAFCLEITESAIMDDPQRALVTLERLSEQGFLLSIDDFGTGYSSLAYLKRLPVDELKIDKSFVMSMESDVDDRKIVRSTIDLAHNLGLTVVAEGVENAKIWDLLRELNCDHAQGYHMGKPMPAADFGRWTESWLGRQRPGSAPRPAEPAVLH